MAEGFFTGTEMAVVHCDKLMLRSRARQGSKRAKIILVFLANPRRFFSTTLLGTNLSVVTASVCTTYYIVQHWGTSYESLALLLAPLTLIFGEIVPKSLYQHYANTIVLRVALPLRVFGWIFSPIVFVLSRLTGVLLGRVSQRVGKELPVTRDELEMLLEEGDKNPSETKEITARRSMISSIFELADKRVANIMTPLVDVEALSLDISHEEACKAFEEEGHSRLPIYQERIVNIVGILTNADLLLSDPETPIKDLMRPAHYVPEGMPLDELFITMKKTGEPMVIVVDEFGGASGILTNEDVFEEIIGEIQDEYDYQPPAYYRIGKGRYLASGRLSISEANEKLKLDIPLGDYETVAGFLIHQMGTIAKSGTIYRFGKLEFIIHRANERAIQEVEIRLF